MRAVSAVRCENGLIVSGAGEGGADLAGQYDHE